VSVINKMLRDLDQRQPVPAADSSQGGVDPVLRQGTSSVPAASAGSRRAAAPRHWLAGVGLLGLVAAVGAAAWWRQAGELPLPGLAALGRAGPADAAKSVVAVAPTQPASTPATPPAVAVSAAASDSSTLSAPVAPAAPAETQANTGDTTATPANGSMVLRMENSLSARRALDALLSSTPTPKPVPASAPAPTSPPAIASKQPAPTAAGARAATMAAASTPMGDSTPIVQRQQQAGGDALAQAQSLWASGSHDAAMDLLQQSIAVAERAAKSAGSTGANPVLLPMVREMARMQLAEGRHGAVWEMLTRLEPLLGNQADLWAIRANAAQRLGRHPDSVHAYMMALQSRPDEQRWLLGAAVSLAALGQTSSAAEMADKARTQGPVSKDILAFLRQAGVPLKD